MEYGLNYNAVEKIHAVFRQFPQVEAAILYGSRAKGNYRNGSDIDLTLKGGNLNHKILSLISSKMDDLLLPYIIDISIYKQIDNPDLIEHIERVGKVFYQKN